MQKPESSQCSNRDIQTCQAASADGMSCRMFLCARCRSHTLICRSCDRGQVYCMGTCARDARGERQREARRRYQATPRGRSMHAERSRRHRARVGRVTDHGPAGEREMDRLAGFEVPGALNAPPSSGKHPGYSRCHHCGHAASTFLRLSALRPGTFGRNKHQIKCGYPRPSRPP